LSAESLRGKLRGHFDPSHRRIFRDVANLVDLNTRFTGERGLQLFCERGGLGVAAWKTAYEAGELRLRQIWREVNAGNARASQQLRETFFTGGCAEWHAVQQDLIP
jgi:transcriptional regulator CtsR